MVSTTNSRPLTGLLSGRSRLRYPGLCVLLATLLWQGTASAVMPPEHYARAAEDSAIKAIAVVVDVTILKETRQSTRKEVLFRLERSFGKEAPRQFRGTCYSVDHASQQPMAGGTIYFYPQKGARVLVTVSDDGGPITSYTPVSDALNAELADSGLANIAFQMGRARLQEPKANNPADRWFTFHLDGRAAGYLRISRQTDRERPMIIQFRHEFLVGEIDGRRQLYTVSTESRDDGTLTPQWLTIETADISPEGREERGKREYGFRISETAQTAAGILSREKTAVDIPLPSGTTTDLVLFEVIRGREFTPGVIRLNVLETLELHLKKDVRLTYTGRDPAKDNLHRFEARGAFRAAYWIDERHDLIEARWDGDKVFRRSSQEGAETVLQ